MRSWKSFAAVACTLVLIISGCSQNDSSDKKMESNANATDTNPPKNDAANTVNDTMDNMMSYLKDQGITIDDMKDLTDMDFAAHEGRSFSYQGNTAYLYRLKENDESMKALLDFITLFDTYQAGIGGIDSSDNSGSATENGNGVNAKKQSDDQNNTVTNGTQTGESKNNTSEEPID